MWKEFFSPSEILETLEFNSNVHDAVEFGCGYSRVRGEDQLISDADFQKCRYEKVAT